MISTRDLLGEEFANTLQRLTNDLDATHNLLRALLKHVGRPAICRGCGAAILWVAHIDSGKHTPYNPDGVNHFATCPKAQEFKRKEKQS